MMALQPPNPGTDSPPKTPEPNQNYGSSDATQYTPPFVSAQPVKDLAYGGAPEHGAGILTGQLYRLERGYPYLRRGTLVPAVPRTKAETVYVRDTNQAEVNKLVNKGGTATPGTTNQPSATGSVNRYRTPYKTIVQ
jgi:hypothetical protein